MEKKDNLDQKKFEGIALIVISGVLLASLLGPWISMDFTWSSTSEIIKGNIQFTSNGLGMGHFQGSFFVNDPANEGTEINSTVSSFNIVPPLLGIGIVHIIVSLINLFIAAVFLFKNFKTIVPKTILKTIEKRWSLIIFIEGIMIISLFALFSTFYYSLPIDITINQAPSQFQQTASTLQNLYQNTYEFFIWSKQTFHVGKINWYRDLTPGIGSIFSFIGGMGLIYIWYLNFIDTKLEWPDVWQKRSLLLPIMFVAAFLPVARQYSELEALTIPLLLSPALSQLGGVIYLGLVLGLFFVVYKVASVENRIDTIVSEIYTRGEETFSEAEFEKLLNNLNQFRSKASKLRKIFFPLVVVILVVIMVVFYDLARLYMTYVGDTIGAQWLEHTFIDWVLLFTPFATIVLSVLYRK